ncbi:UDP-glucose 4-epimerase GalE [Sinomonas sp. ASV322]|uniref:UDP-glucose 4-epimerase GalE n=1 Tax=Sinomonas sp. ASV322 TaxID=3041920 RepID=UPI0027DC485E|nr:UDP-glucose 4-epimerase GalE [Sinomonas sp. ASV322]MDQ4501898.1 UDP-glucose 4-epimerase GalE [Sinomonas sp. ASV322]
MRILITGGAGYIGSHTAFVLLEKGHDVTVFDNFATSTRISLDRVERLAGRTVSCIEGDLRDRPAVAAAVHEAKPAAVVHFAGLKSVGESTARPLLYVANNVSGTVNLLDAMDAAGVRRFIFSSSATVYGAAGEGPCAEEDPLAVTNPYGRTKLMVEEILRDLAASDARWGIAVLRYFNPVGAHESGSLGEAPQGTPSNLVPLVGQVAAGTRAHVDVYGGDYPTRDGTGVRDYIHVMDLAAGHLAALERVLGLSGVGTWNLGTGRGHSVLEIIRTYAKVSRREIPYRVVGRRDGDVATSRADVAKARRELGWRARRGLLEMIEDHWRWQSLNPSGYRS